MKKATQAMKATKDQSNTMNRLHQSLFLCAALAVALTGCSEEGDPIERIQTNLVDKSIFEGVWWYSTTNIDVGSDEAFMYGMSGAFAPWTGDMSSSDIALNAGTMARIRWVIDEDFLFAYRAYEIIAGGNRDGRDEDFRGQPLAVFRINGHINIQCEYNPVTGECTNVIGESSSDARWFDTQFMRVDWSQNLITDYYADSADYNDLFIGFGPESVPFHIQEGADASAFPEEWKPQFVRVREESNFETEKNNEGYRWLAEWPAGSEDVVHYMSFVTQEVHSPHGGGALTPVNVTRRHAFLRVPPGHEYAAETQPHAEYDRFGIIRSEQRTYVRGGEDRATRHRYCTPATVETDCGVGGACGMDSYCVGGLTGDIGETDFLSFYRLRHNFYADSLTDTLCEADWECDGRYDASAGTPGSVCDRAARRCTIPMRDRPTRPVAYHLNAKYPTYLVRSAYEVMGDWNAVFMTGQRAVTGRAMPVGPRVACQDRNPGEYCFCGSVVSGPEVDVATRTCEWKYNPFQSPADATAAGVENAFDCYIDGPDDVATPETLGAYGPEQYEYSFVGEECLFILKTNSCDLDPTASCERMGDIRYQFFNHIENSHVPFCGVMEPLQDPLNGEAIVSPANMSNECLEYYATQASHYWPVLRGEISEDEYFQGEDIRGYFQRLGRVEHPPAIARSGDDGHTINDTTRPGLPLDFIDNALASIESRRDELMQLQGNDSQAVTFDDRLRTLAGTDVEARLMGSMAAGGWEMMERSMRGNELDAPPAFMSDEVLDRVSPFRTSFAQGPGADIRRMQILSERGFEPPASQSDIYTSRYQKWWADAFTGRSPAQADVRWRQAQNHSIMLHEIGHAIGLEHNFGASLDRNNYNHGYYNLARDLPLPDFNSYDDPSMGGNGDSALNGPEWDRYLADLRRVRNERAARGGGNTMASSVMEYPGDYSRMSGLGPYDQASTLYNYFNRYEAYSGDPRDRVCTGDSDCGAHGTCDAGVCEFDASAASLDFIHWSDQRPRVYWSFYRGGERCQTDNQCPYSNVDEDGEDLDGDGRGDGDGILDGNAALADGQAVHQRCIVNPRYERLPRPCTGTDSNCICSTYDEDFKDYVDGVAYRAPSSPLDYFPTDYLFCSNSRANDISWCSMGDAGESFREVVDHFRRGWEESYPQVYYRRNRLGYPGSAASITGILATVKIYQHFLFRLFYEPGFGSDEGPLGVDSQYMASADAMNWFTELANLPDVGSYDLDTDTNVYRQMGGEPGMTGADFSLLPGQGFHEWSAYQEGIQGRFRRERSGVFWDKFYGMLGLAQRDWDLGFTVDEKFRLNFYDLFGVEMTEFFGGMILDDPRWFAPRVRMEAGGPVIQNVNWFRGRCADTRGVFVPCRGSTPDIFPGAVVGNTSSVILREWATILALAFFPVWYDTSFEQRLMVFREGSGDGWDLPAVRPDGTPICEYGVAGCTTPGFIRYTSDRLHDTYRAVIITPRLEFNLPEEQIGYELLLRLRAQQAEVRRLTAIVSPTPAEVQELSAKRRELESNESYLQNLIELQGRFGISQF